MKYNFSSCRSRFNEGSRKFEIMKEMKPGIGEDVVPLSVADMEFNIAPEIAEGLAEFVRDSVLGYPCMTDGYKEAVLSWFKRRYSWEIEKDWIVDSSGVVPAIFASVEGLTEPGDGVIVFPPVYGPFFMAVENKGRLVKRCDLIEGDPYQIDFEKLEEFCKDDKNKLILLCNPHNPIGRVWTRDELERISSLAVKYGLKVFSDEIHADLILPGNEFVSFGTVNEDISVVATAPSKTFNIAGLATSNIIIKDEKMREAVSTSLAKSFSKGCNILGYKACEIAYTKCDDWLDELISVLDENTKFAEDFIRERLPQIGVNKNQATYLLYLDMRKLGLDDNELKEFLNQKAEIFYNPGSFFRDQREGFIRLNIALAKKDLEKALLRLEAAIKEMI